MNIFIESGPMFGQRTGVGQYTKHLTEALVKLDQGNHYTLFSFLFLGRRAQLPIATTANLSYRFVRFIPGRVYNRLRKYHLAPPIDLLLLRRPDLVFYPNFMRYPLALGEPSILVVHDLAFKLFPDFIEAKNLKDLENNLGRSIRRASAVVAVSENTKRDIIKFYGTPDEKISVVPPAIDHEHFRPRSEEEIVAVRKKYGLPENYVLYTGTLEPRKNVVGILDAYRQLPEELREKHALVLAGGKGWRDDAIQNHLGELKQKHQIFLPGYIDDTDLPALYSGASAFVFPTFYEGFGIPPLEAMACGVPVVTSGNSSLPEVIGEAGLTADPHDPAQIGAQVQKVLTDPSLANQLKESGLARAKEFTWDSSAREILKVVKQVTS